MFLPFTLGVIQLSPRPTTSFSVDFTANLRENRIQSTKKEVSVSGELKHISHSLDASLVEMGCTALFTFMLHASVDYKSHDTLK